MAIEYLSYAGAMPYRAGESTRSTEVGNFQAGETTSWDASGGVSYSFSSSNDDIEILYSDSTTSSSTVLTITVGEGEGGPDYYTSFYTYGSLDEGISSIPTGEIHHTTSFSTSDTGAPGSYEQEMQTTTTVVGVDYLGTTTGTCDIFVPLVTTGSSGSQTFYTTGGSYSTSTQTTVSQRDWSYSGKSVTYGQLALTTAGVTTITGAAMWNTVVIADTARGEFLIIPTSQGVGMLSDLCTTATATTLLGSPERGNGAGANAVSFEIPTSSNWTFATTVGTESRPCFNYYQGFPVQTDSSEHAITSSSSSSTAFDTNDASYENEPPAPTSFWLVPKTVGIHDATAPPYTKPYSGPGADAWFWAVNSTGRVVVDVGLGSPYPARPALGIFAQAVAEGFQRSDFSIPRGYGIPPQTTNFTGSAGFAQVIDAGVSLASYPPEQFVQVYPGVSMPMPVSTYLELDRILGGAIGITTSATVSYASSGYLVTTATSSGSGTNATRVTGSTFYSFSTKGSPETRTALFGIAGGNPFFTDATYAGVSGYAGESGSSTVEIQTWNASSSGTEMTTFTGSDEIGSNDGLTRIVPDMHATAYSQWQRKFYYGEAGDELYPPPLVNYYVTSFA